ncbi:MAG: methyltransferase domain-containing protein [Dehalococcoidales bacterium]|jgi:SAM-dependent methyltransferase
MNLMVFLRRCNAWRRKLFRKKVAWHNLRSVHPLSDIYGLDRGQALDRYYIEQFLEANRKHVKGIVLEVNDNLYTKLYGGNKVTRSEILDIEARNKQATIIADLSKADAIAAGTFDCFILTQTLQFIFNTEAAIVHSQRILKPGGVLLATLPCVSRIDCVAGIEGDFWRFTRASAERLFTRYFGQENVTVETHGNVLADISFLMGLASDELTRKELDFNDPDFPLIVSVRAVKKE